MSQANYSLETSDRTIQRAAVCTQITEITRSHKHVDRHLLWETAQGLEGFTIIQQANWVEP